MRGTDVIQRRRGDFDFSVENNMPVATKMVIQVSSNDGRPCPLCSTYLNRRQRDRMD
jgi:hypothetical protein